MVSCVTVQSQIYFVSMKGIKMNRKNSYEEINGKFIFYSSHIPIVVADKEIEIDEIKFDKLCTQMEEQIQEFGLEKTIYIDSFTKNEHKELKKIFIKWFFIFLMVLTLCVFANIQFARLSGELPDKMIKKIDKLIDSSPEKKAVRLRRFKLFLEQSKPFIKEIKDSFADQ